MATKDSFPPDDRFPVFLSENAEEIGEPGIDKAWYRAEIASRILKVSIFAAVATAIGIAILLVGNPASLVADVTAALTDKSEVQPVTDPSTATTPSIAAAQDSQIAVAQDTPQVATDAPTLAETAAAPEPAGQSRAELDPPPSEAMFKQFQAWAAEEDARAQPEPARPSQNLPPVQAMQDTPARVAQESPPAAHVQPAKKQRRARSAHNARDARAEVRPHRQHYRARYREEPAAPVPLAPVPDARAQEQALQAPQAPTFLQSIGLR